MGSPTPRSELNFANGDKYVGNLKNGKPDGNGILILSNGDRYAGDFKAGKFDGQGTYSFRRTYHRFDEGEYVGTFKEGGRHGQGTLNFRKSMGYLNQDYDSEVQYVGNIKEYSEGKQYLEYAEKYVGEFKNNIFYGQDISHGLDELCWDYHSVFAVGLWIDDKFLTIKVSSSGSNEIIYPDYSERESCSETEKPPEVESEISKLTDSTDVKQVLQTISNNLTPKSMIEFSVPDMIDELEVIPRLKEIHGLTITSYRPPVAYIFNVTGEDIEFEFENYYFSAITYPDYYLWTFYVDSQCPKNILSKFIAHLQKAK